MLRFFLGADEDVARWVTERIKGFDDTSLEDFGPYTTMGLWDGETAVAGFVFNKFRRMAWGADIEITMAADSPRWASRRIINTVLQYPFEQLDCVRVTGVVSRRNKRNRRFLKGIGFREEGIVRKGWDGRTDAVIYGLLRDVWERQPNLRTFGERHKSDAPVEGEGSETETPEAPAEAPPEVAPEALALADIEPVGLAVGAVDRADP